MPTLKYEPFQNAINEIRKLPDEEAREYFRNYVEAYHMPERKVMPRKREGKTYETKIGTTPLYLRTGEYEDGLIGEIFIDMFKEGGGYRAILNCFAISISLGLQYGIPIHVFIDKFIGVKFEPSGRTDNPEVSECASIIDYIFRVIENDYVSNKKEEENDGTQNDTGGV